ncbi:hypothetical protein UG55_102459 [Frankia sp. EI5c]|nr:hypothetical protein UG55_102459 [Frankia sp. EI5c]
MIFQLVPHARRVDEPGGDDRCVTGEAGAVHHHVTVMQRQPKPKPAFRAARAVVAVQRNAEFPDQIGDHPWLGNVGRDQRQQAAAGVLPDDGERIDTRVSQRFRNHGAEPFTGGEMAEAGQLAVPTLVQGQHRRRAWVERFGLHARTPW